MCAVTAASIRPLTLACSKQTIHKPYIYLFLVLWLHDACTAREDRLRGLECMHLLPLRGSFLPRQNLDVKTKEKEGYQYSYFSIRNALSIYSTSYLAVHPPSIDKHAPVMADASSVQR